MGKKIGIILVFLSIFIFALNLNIFLAAARSVRNCQGSNVIDTDSCILCGAFHPAWREGTNECVYLRAGEYSGNRGGRTLTYKIMESGCYHCDDFVNCSERERSTLLCRCNGCGVECTPSCVCNEWVNSSWGACNSSGIQRLNSTRSCNSVCGGNCSNYETIRFYTRPCIYLEIPYFAKLNEPNVPISSADFGDTVLLRFGGNNISEDANLTFHVQLKENSSWSNLWGIIKRWSSFSVISGSPYSPYTLINLNNHRLNASVQGENVWKISNELIVKPINNSAPIAKITNPLYNHSNPEEIYKTSVNQEVEFKQRSYDEDDLLKIVWEFGDGTNRTIENFSLELNQTHGDVNKSYSVEGIYDITLKVSEMYPQRTSPQSSLDRTKVYVFKEGINIFPIISSPTGGEIGNIIKFNASQSYIVNCSRNLIQYNFTAGYLKCVYILERGAKSPKIGNVFLRWKQSENGRITWKLICPLNNQNCNNAGESWEGVRWNETNYEQIGGVVFTMPFFEAKERWVKLEMKFEN